MKPTRILKWIAAAIPLVLLLALVVAYSRSDNSCADLKATTPHAPMKAVVYCEYGSSDVLTIQNVEKPVPGDDQMLVRVRAASVNPVDWHFMRGQPYIARLGMGLRKPKAIRIGVDYAGTVDAVCRNVT